MYAPMQSSDIIDQNAPKLLLNYDVAEMIERVVAVLKLFGKNVDRVDIDGRKMRGVLYQDSVVTIMSDRMKRNIVAYRNRTGTLVAGIANGIVNAYHWEIVFIDRHLKRLADSRLP